MNQPTSNDHKDLPVQVEPMIDAKQAACSLRLPLYWFADQKQRAKYRIPHYLMGGLVRFRMTELIIWAANSRVASGAIDKSRQIGDRS